MRDIELNPVRAGVVDHPGEYPRTVTFSISIASQMPLSPRTPCISGLDRTDQERRSAYRQLLHAQLSEVDIGAIRETTNMGWALGHDRFRARIETLTGRRFAPFQRGRPRLGEDDGKQFESDPIS